MKAFFRGREGISDQTAKPHRQKQNRVGQNQPRLGFETLEPRTLLAATTAIQSGNWDSPSTWSAGVPDDATRAIIPSGRTVTLSGTDHIAQEIVVQGTLNVAESAGTTKTLTSDWIHVNSGGVFQIGTAANRYDENDFIVTLTGDDPTETFTIEGAGTITNNNGFLMVAGGGRLQFFGKEKLTFTKLARTAEVNDTQILVEKQIDRDFDGDLDSDDGSLNWEVGDQIVIASSSTDYDDEEVRIVNAIDDQGDGTALITLNAPLNNRHYGEIETYTNGDPLPGDFNRDGKVDHDDLTVWQNHYGDTNETALSGAGDGSNRVDGGDYLLWSRQYGKTIEEEQGARTWSIDMRAEVAILNRNVRIQGLASHDTDNQFGDRARFNAGTGDGFGAHSMIMASAGQITIDSVQFDRMGQTGRLGRYPVHWHIAGDRSGDVLRGASITNSNNRGVTVHGTHNLLIEGVVLHDVHGHGFFMEDAVETGNRFIANIAYGIHKVGRSAAVGNFAPDLNDPFIVDTHDHVGQNQNRFLSSSAYWITNPDNTWIGNISAGSEGTGFWFILPDEAIGAAANDPQYNNVNASRTNLRQFDYNSSHSSPAGLNFDRGSDIEKPVGAQLKAFFDGDQWLPPQEPQINNYTAYKHRVGVYHRGQQANFHENLYADNFTSTFITFTQRITDTLYVGHSRGNADFGDTVTGHTIYDGANTLDGNHFAGYAANNAHTFRVHSAANRFTSHVLSNTTYEEDGSSGNVSIANQGGGSNHNQALGGATAAAIYDVDGTLTGHVGGGPGSTVVSNHPFFYDSDDFRPAGWNAWVTDDVYAQLLFKPNNSNATFRITSPDGDSDTESGSSFNTHVKTNDGDYVVDFPNGVGSVSNGFRLKHFMRVGPNNGSTVIRFAGLGNVLAPRNVPFVGSLTTLRSAAGTSYTVVGSDLYVKFFSSSNDRVFDTAPPVGGSATLWEDNSPLSGTSILGPSLSVNTVDSFAATGDASRGDIGEVVLEGTDTFGNINGGAIDISPSQRGQPYTFTIDYFVPVGTTLDGAPGGSQDRFFLQISFDGANSGSAGFIDNDDVGTGWNRITLTGNVPGSANVVVPLLVVADRNTPGNGTGTAFYIDNISLTIGAGALTSGEVAAIAASTESTASSVPAHSTTESVDTIVARVRVFEDFNTPSSQVAALEHQSTDQSIDTPSVHSDAGDQAELQWLSDELLERVFG